MPRLIYLIPSEHLSPVLVHNTYMTRRLHPGFSVDLNRHSLLSHNGDLYTTTLCTNVKTLLSTTFSKFFNHSATDNKKTKQHQVKLYKWTIFYLFTCAMRCLCTFSTRDIPSCTLPNTATTSRILSSKLGATKFWGGDNLLNYGKMYSESSTIKKGNKLI